LKRNAYIIESMSALTYIVFLSPADEERGFGLLIRRAPVRAYAHGVYGVDPAATTLLTQEGVGYREATCEEIASNVPGRPVRNPAAAHLQ
jgi:hypothetical protein